MPGVQGARVRLTDEDLVRIDELCELGASDGLAACFGPLLEHPHIDERLDGSVATRPSDYMFPSDLPGILHLPQGLVESVSHADAIIVVREQPCVDVIKTGYDGVCFGHGGTRQHERQE